MSVPEAHPDNRLTGPEQGAPPDRVGPTGQPPAASADSGSHAPVPSGSTSPGRPRRWLLPAVLAAVVLLALAAVGVTVVWSGPAAEWRAGEQPAAQPPPAVLTAADQNAPEPAAAGVRAVLDPLVGSAALGDRVNVSVTDVATGSTLYDQGADIGTVPASVTKLVTAATVLAARGPGHRIPTRAVAGAAPGEVVLIGGGDPTLAVDDTGFYPGAARLDELAAQVKAALGGVAPTRVVVDSSLYSGPVHAPGWDDDIPTGGYGSAITALMTDGARSDLEQAKRDHDDGAHGAERVKEPDLHAGAAFARLLGVPEDAVKRGPAPEAGADASAGATAGAPGGELGVVQSLPMVRLVDIMIADSDNVVAEALARQVALARGQPASFSGAGESMEAVAGELGLPVDALTLTDGSGLSRANRISPSLLTDLIRLAADGSRPELTTLFGGLPVAAWSGTLADRYTDVAAQAGAGAVRAKTGTLTGVHAIAGLVTTADGRLLTFAVLTDRTPADGLEATRLELDRIAAALAACGCR
ncbi:D-alanyl-D-alanine carboxypeptidase/D-alanyl-D-alanine endopeptidase [Salinispora cortesiana]|uniref:D-alanyl-D-alanine carboxypeptidase/D-alanyl-D-alanine endopeptidase n=1 Tax=Salinispora cortesiana TaxID=1305843 RepID=UPI000414868D